MTFLKRPNQLDFGGVLMRHRQPPYRAISVPNIDDAPIRKDGHSQTGNALQCALIVRQLRQRGTGVGQEARRLRGPVQR